jgi:hypothetical protein
MSRRRRSAGRQLGEHYAVYHNCYETSPPLQNSCHLPIFKASEATLQVLRQKTGNCGSFRPDGTTRQWSCLARCWSCAEAQGVAARILAHRKRKR